MTGLILLILAQGTPAPEKPIEERIEAFLKGDAAARIADVGMGPLRAHGFRS